MLWVVGLFPLLALGRCRPFFYCIAPPAARYDGGVSENPYQSPLEVGGRWPEPESLPVPPEDSEPSPDIVGTAIRHFMTGLLILAFLGLLLRR